MRKHEAIIRSLDDPFFVEYLNRDERPWYIPDETRAYLQEKYDYTCAICRRKTFDLHIDHILPVSKGGKAHMANLQVLCSRCNLEKSNNRLLPDSYVLGYVVTAPNIEKTDRFLRGEFLFRIEGDNY